MARSPTDTINFLTLEELARLFSATRANRRDRALFLIAYRHGLLRVDDIDFRALRIVLHRLKSSHSGTHPLQPDEAKALRAYLRQRPDPVSEQPRRSDRAAHFGLADEALWCRRRAS